MEKGAKLSLMEFQNYCEKIHPKRYVFNKHNLFWEAKSEKWNVQFSFDKMKIMYNPNSICFMLGEKNPFGKYENYLTFEGLKYIIFKENIADNSLFTMVCGSSQEDRHNKKYNVFVMTS